MKANDKKVAADQEKARKFRKELLFGLILIFFEEVEQELKDARKKLTELVAKQEDVQNVKNTFINAKGHIHDIAVGILAIGSIWKHVCINHFSRAKNL